MEVRRVKRSECEVILSDVGAYRLRRLAVGGEGESKVLAGVDLDAEADVDVDGRLDG